MDVALREGDDDAGLLEQLRDAEAQIAADAAQPAFAGRAYPEVGVEGQNVQFAGRNAPPPTLTQAARNEFRMGGGDDAGNK